MIIKDKSGCLYLEDLKNYNYLSFLGVLMEKEMYFSIFLF